MTRNRFGICVVGDCVVVYTAGNVDYELSIQSVSKPFSLRCDFSSYWQSRGANHARSESHQAAL